MHRVLLYKGVPLLYDAPLPIFFPNAQNPVNHGLIFFRQVRRPALAVALVVLIAIVGVGNHLFARNRIPMYMPEVDLF